jgi:sugar lactone lactonase YvrE
VIADSHNGVLRLVDAAGTIRTLSTGMIGPIVVEGGPFDTLYVADARLAAVFRFDASGGSRTQVADAVAAIGMAVDRDQNVYVSELEARRVLRVSRRGRRTVLVP